jgi:signal peptidase
VSRRSSTSEHVGTTAEPAAPREKGLGHYLSVAISLAVFLIVVALAAVLIVIPKVSGSIPLTVLTSSMEPSLPPGTLIIVQPVDVADLKIGDVATYQISSGRPGVITHRITEVNSTSTGELSFTFKGDNNADIDSKQVVPGQIQGRVWYSVPYMGFVNNTVNGENRSWIIPVLSVALIGYAGFMIASGLVSALRTKKGRGRRALGR